MLFFQCALRRFISGCIIAYSAVCCVTVLAAEAQVYGSYNMGCLEGAQELPLEGDHYVTQQWGAGRNFAHPDLIDYIKKLTAKAKAAGLPALVIGDLSRIHGGPYVRSNHSSHMVGLDVDIPFGFAADVSKRARTTPDNFYLVKNGRLTDNFDAQRATLIYLAAQDDRVERIFVSPRIKEGMCHLYESKGDDAWLRRLRPWFGHRAHMHVRLSCPVDSPYCKSQVAVPEGTGCGAELQSWFMPPDPRVKPASPVQREKPQMPEQCRLLLGLKH